MNPTPKSRLPGMLVDVIKFEFARSITFGRVSIWLLLTLFPVFILGLLRLQNNVDVIDPWGMAVYFLVTEVLCLLGLLLWATPVVSTELEGQTWIYLATRSSGRWIVVLGKYVTAVAWTFAAAAVSVLLCTLLMAPHSDWTFWWVLTSLSFFSCVAHAALYALIGVLFFRRTMVAAVLYTMIVEFGLSFVPAIVNQLTINYRLRGLLADWTQWENVRSLAEATLGIEPARNHLIALSIVTVCCLVLVVWRVRRAEFPTQQDGGT